MKVKEHAVDRYIERVLDKKPEDASTSLREKAEERIKKVAKEPDVIYHGDKDKAPVHIIWPVAAIVDEDGDGTGVTKVPTVYHAKVFIKKINERAAA